MCLCSQVQVRVAVFFHTHCINNIVHSWIFVKAYSVLAWVPRHYVSSWLHELIEINWFCGNRHCSCVCHSGVMLFPCLWNLNTKSNKSNIFILIAIRHYREKTKVVEKYLNLFPKFYFFFFFFCTQVNVKLRLRSHSFNDSSIELKHSHLVQFSSAVLKERKNKTWLNMVMN